MTTRFNTDDFKLAILKHENSDYEKEIAKKARRAAEYRLDSHLSDPEKADLIVAFGGDGTALNIINQTVKMAKKGMNVPPVMLVNYGDVGAMTMINRIKYERIKNILRFFTVVATYGEREIHHPGLAQIYTQGSDGKEICQEQNFVNELTLMRSSRTGQSCHLKIQSAGLNEETKGDGCIFATDVGSTGYYRDVCGSSFKVDALGVMPIGDIDSVVRFGGIYPADKKVQVSVINTNQKRPVHANTDNNPQIDDVTRCIVGIDQNLSYSLIRKWKEHERS